MGSVVIAGGQRGVRLDLVNSFEKANYHVLAFSGWEEVGRKIGVAAIDLLVLQTESLWEDNLLMIRDLRHNTSLPIILISPDISERGRIMALEAGVDDCLLSPISPREVLLRAQAIWRRMSPSFPCQEPLLWRCGTKTMEAYPRAYRLLLEGAPLALTAAEWRIFLYLSQNGPNVVTRHQILLHALPSSFSGEERRIDTHIKNMRAKMGAEWIQTVRGLGYRFTGISLTTRAGTQSPSQSSSISKKVPLK